MSLTSWLSRQFRFREFIDSFCLTRSGLTEEICRIAGERVQLNELVLLISHFPETFLQIQQQLEADGVEYDVQAKTLDESCLLAFTEEANTGRLVLTLGDMLSELSMSHQNFSRSRQISVIVAERHPLASRDLAVVCAAREFPFPTSLGFFVALDDPLLEPMNADWVGNLLRQMGAGERELISSQMVSRRVRAAQRRLRKYDGNSQPADSATAWFAANGLTN